MKFALYVPYAGRAVAESLKHWDVVETDISHPNWPKFSVIAESVARSDMAYSVLSDEGMPFAVGGVGGDGCIWMLSTDYIKTSPRQVVKLSREFIQDCIYFGYKRLYNRVHKDNKTTLKWLKALGFKTKGKPNRKGMITVEKQLWY